MIIKLSDPSHLFNRRSSNIRDCETDRGDEYIVSSPNLRVTIPSQIELKLNHDQFVRVHPISGKGSAVAVNQLEKSMRLNGFDINKPIEVVIHNDKFYIIDGHHRYRAAKMAGINEIPVKIISDIKNHSSSWNTVEEVVKDASSCGIDRLKFKY